MENTRSSLLLSTILFVVLIGFSSGLYAQNSNEDTPRYHELPKFENNQDIEMVAEEAENTLQIAHLSFAAIKGLSLTEEAKVEDLSEYTIRLSDMPIQLEEGMNIHNLDELAPIEFISRAESNSGPGIVFAGGTCTTSY